MSWSILDRTVALGGIVQALSLVRTLAKTGKFDAIYFEICIDSIFKIDSQSPQDIYGGIENIHLGLTTVDQLLSPNVRGRDYELFGYLIQIVSLERKLRQSPDALTALKKGIGRAALQAQHFGTFHENVVTSLAQLYQDTISPLGKKIMINGDPGFLNTRGYPEKIRALLLAGMRASVLWHQTGGSLWQLFFSRRQYVTTARASIIDKQKSGR